MEIRKHISAKQKILLFALFVFVLFLTWFLVRFFTIDTSLTLINDYKLPGSNSLKDIYDLEEGDYAIAIDGKVVTGKSFELGQAETRPTASTAKMILGLAVMREKPFSLGESGETLTISADDYTRYVWYVRNDGSNAAVRVGEEISEYDALAEVFLVSANNMADSLAIWAFGSLDNYREAATNMLAEWGIKNTVIGEDASGFSDTTTSTAEDLAIIGQKVLENPVLKEIVGTKTYTVPVVGTITNTNQILGKNRIIGVKTGFIGDASGYCLISGYLEGEHIITLALMNASTRWDSFAESLAITDKMQETAKTQRIVSDGEKIGHYESWWTGDIDIKATEDLDELLWAEATTSEALNMYEETGTLEININDHNYKVNVSADEYQKQPTFFEKIMHVFGWEKETEENSEPEIFAKEEDAEKDVISIEPITNAESDNCTIKFGNLMLINPNFMVENDFIAARKSELVSIYELYGIVEGNPYNGDNLLDVEAAVHINDMVNAYMEEYPGHVIETRSCFRSVGTNCGRLCAATGASDHHTGLTCDLLDPVYGTSLDTDLYDQHIEWQWLKENSYKYGFIDRFPVAWAGGPMSEPLNVDENGSTGLYETWHYRYVGIPAATEIATGKYNNGEYDSLEHYLEAKGLIGDLKSGTCE